MTLHSIPPEEQTIKLNRYLIDNAEQLLSPVITVGGQAVMYWYATYMSYYHEQPDMTPITSNDVDYVARRESVEIIARIFNVESRMQEIFNPPSIALLSLTDKDTGRVKQDGQGLFLNENVNEANWIDIIDRPSGFDPDDFTGDKLYLNTEPYYVMPDRHGAEMSNDLVRVLNPISCIRSRLSNATTPMGKDKITEAARIRILALPAFNFLLEKLQTLPFRKARRYIDYFLGFIWSRPFRHFQAEHKIPLYCIVEQLILELRENPEDDIPPGFYLKELPEKVTYYRREYERYLNMLK